MGRMGSRLPHALALMEHDIVTSSIFLQGKLSIEKYGKLVLCDPWSDSLVVLNHTR